MVFSILSSIMVALLELCCARSKPDKVATVILEMEELVQEEIDGILNHCKCY